MQFGHPARKSIAVIGTGISGLSAAWLLSREHDVTVYEQAGRIGGHSNTVTVRGPSGDIAVDTGFIVYNELTYPNLTALFAHLEVPTKPSDMSFAVSLDGGSLEYSGGNLGGLFAQRRNLLRPRFWSMLSDLRRFYREAPRDVVALDEARTTLGDYLAAGRYGSAFCNDHLLPMASAIWSASVKTILDYPATSFIRFYDNHGLLKITNRPQWRTVSGGSRSYVAALTRGFADRIRIDAGAVSIMRGDDEVHVRDRLGGVNTFDDVVIATHADEALKLLDAPDARERHLLGAFRYSRNRAVLHADPALMPKRRAIWASWNYISPAGGAAAQPDCPMVTYWMNALQGIPHDAPLFVTLNPAREPKEVFHEEIYDHPVFDTAAISAQRHLWSLQGERNTWFCGAYFGAGFHEDGLQAGLAVAEAVGNVRRPWDVEGESARIVIHPPAGDVPRGLVA